MTTGVRGGSAAVPWLLGQALAFGIMAALLGIVANAMFLDAYGSGWLPATYIAIGLVGAVVSGAVARAAGAADLVPIALVVLGTAALGIGVSWAVAIGGDGAWVSIPLLVLFPILIQLGFVFIGAQGGRVLDIDGIKRFFPRIFAGFPIGAVLGGVLGGWLVTWTGRVEDLLLATAIAQGSFALLVWATGRRFATLLHLGSDGSGSARSPEPPPLEGEDEGAGPSLVRLLATPFVALILAYQVLSALASQLADFLVYDRAVAQYPDPADLARYLSAYTAVMNIASIGFLVIVAGPLLRRLGLRFGIAANPVGLTAFAVAMVATFAVAGGGSLGLLLVVSAARIADIALTDGTTRTSINAVYQVLPERTRLPVQTAVEGIGVPVAIGVSGVLILLLTALPDALAATLAVTTVTCLVWTWSAVLLYRAYGPALVDALRRRRWLDADAEAELEVTAADEAIARRLVIDADPRTARLGFELLASAGRPGLAADLRALATNPRPDVRLAALAGLAAMGDATARGRLADEVRVAAGSPLAADRERAARAAAELDPEARLAVAGLLRDPDPHVRAAAFDAVRAGDAFAVGPALDGLGDPRTLAAAAGALGRLGDVVVGVLAAELDGAPSPAPVEVGRLVRAVAAPSPARDEVLGRHLAHPDRELGLVVTERLIGPTPAPTAIAAALDAVLSSEVAHAARVLAALVAVGGEDGALGRALEEELDLVRRRIVAGRLARYGSDRLGPPTTEIATGGPGAALAVEALGVLLGSGEAAMVVALLRPGVAPGERLAGLPRPSAAPDDVRGWLRELIEDPDGAWRSPWLRACAIRAARLRGALEDIDLRGARAAHDPVIDEELTLAG